VRRDGRDGGKLLDTYSAHGVRMAAGALRERGDDSSQRAGFVVLTTDMLGASINQTLHMVFDRWDGANPPAIVIFDVH